MKAKSSLTSATFDVEWRVFNYIQDKCCFKFTKSRGDSDATAISEGWAIDGNEYAENRTIPYKGYSSSFDIATYARQATIDWPSRFALYGCGTIADWNTKIVTAWSETFGDTTASGTLPMLFLNGSNVRNEKMCATRVHLYNPNYPTIAEWMPVDDDTLQLRFNTEEPCIYSVGISSTDNYPTAQVLLNKYTDDRYNEEGVLLNVTYPRHLEPSKEPNTTYSAVSDFSFADVRSTCTDTRTDVYIYDTRTKGVFLRFIDRFGFIQQILLDVSSRESAVTSGDAMQTYLGKEIGYTDNVCEGNGVTSLKSEADTIHCGLNGIRKELVGDITDLLMSPKVYMYRGGFNDATNDDSNCKWEAVLVTSQGISMLEKKATFDVSIDVTITNRNAYAV